MNKASGYDGIPSEQFKILNDNAVEVLHSIMSANLETSSGHRTGKGQFSFQSQSRAVPSVQTTAWLHSFSMLVRWCSKSFKLGFNSMCTKNFQMYKLGLERAELPKINLPTFTGSWRKQGNTRKTSASLTMQKALTVWITNCRKFLKRWEHQTTFPVSWETLYTGQEAAVRTRHGTTDRFKLEKEYSKAVYYHTVYLTSTCEMLGWMKHNLESRWLGEIYQQPQICRW